MSSASSSEDQTVGAIQVEPGSMNAAGKQSSRKGLLLAGVDHPQAVGIGGYVGPQVTRAAVGAFNFLEDEIFQLAGGYFVTIAQTVTNGARDGIGRVEVQAALDEVVGDHAAQKALPDCRRKTPRPAVYAPSKSCEVYRRIRWP